MNHPPEPAPLDAEPFSDGPPVDSASPERVLPAPVASEILPPEVTADRPLFMQIGPGLFESLGWIVGLGIVVLLSETLMKLVLIFMTPLGEPGSVDFRSPDWFSEELVRALSEQLASNRVFINGWQGLTAVVYAVAVIRLRFGWNGFWELGWQRPWNGHWFLIVALSLPLSFLSNVMSATFRRAVFGDYIPTPEVVRTMATMANCPILLLLFVYGFLPVFGKELLFRGMVGRGLIRSFGLCFGLIATSVLFGMSRIVPIHVIAAIPLGLAVHIVYYTTRSLWAPITLHCLAISLPIVFFEYRSVTGMRELGLAFAGRDMMDPLPMIVSSVAAILASLMIFWQTRVQFVLKDGTIWNPGFATTAVPPTEIGATGRRKTAELGAVFVLIVCICGFAFFLGHATDWFGRNAPTFGIPSDANSPDD